MASSRSVRTSSERTNEHADRTRTGVLARARARTTAAAPRLLPLPPKRIDGRRVSRRRHEQQPREPMRQWRALALPPPGLGGWAPSRPARRGRSRADRIARHRDPCGRRREADRRAAGGAGSAVPRTRQAEPQMLTACPRSPPFRAFTRSRPLPPHHTTQRGCLVDENFLFKGHIKYLIRC